MERNREILKCGKTFKEPSFTEGIMCVYKLIFDNSTFFIGSTSDLKKRVQVYRSQINCGTGQNKKLIATANESKSIEIVILEVVEDKGLLVSREGEYIRSSFNNFCLNRAINGHSNKGINWTEEEKAKISKGMKGLIRNEATRMKMRMSRIGKKLNRHKPKKNTTYPYTKVCQCLCTGRILRYKNAAAELEVSREKFSSMMVGSTYNWSYFIPLNPIPYKKRCGVRTTEQKLLDIPIALDWVEFKGETVVAQGNYEATERAGRPMVDISYCMTRALNGVVIKTVLWTKKHFKPSSFGVSKW